MLVVICELGHASVEFRGKDKKKSHIFSRRAATYDHDKLNIEMKQRKCIIELCENGKHMQSLKKERNMMLRKGKYFIFIKYNYCACMLSNGMSLTIRKM